MIQSTHVNFARLQYDSVHLKITFFANIEFIPMSGGQLTAIMNMFRKV